MMYAIILDSDGYFITEHPTPDMTVIVENLTLTEAEDQLLRLIQQSE